MSDDHRKLTPPPGRGLRAFEEPMPPLDDRATIAQRDTDKPPPVIVVEPHDMTDRELMIEAVVFAREHNKEHTNDEKSRKALERVCRQLDAQDEMLATSLEVILRKVECDEAANELAMYWRTKRNERDAAADAAAKTSYGGR